MFRIDKAKKKSWRSAAILSQNEIIRFEYIHLSFLFLHSFWLGVLISDDDKTRKNYFVFIISPYILQPLKPIIIIRIIIIIKK